MTRVKLKLEQQTKIKVKLEKANVIIRRIQKRACETLPQLSPQIWYMFPISLERFVD